MNVKFKRNIKMAILISAMFLLTIIIIQRPYRNVLTEVIIFSEGGVFVGSSVYRFIVQNDGTFTSYTGIAIHTNAERPNTIMLPFIRRRARIILNDDDLYNISQMVIYATESYATTQSRVLGLWEVMVLHDNKVYKRQTIELREIADELVRLSPLMTQWHDPRLTSNP